MFKRIEISYIISKNYHFNSESEVFVMKIGVADYGMTVWDGGLYDIGQRLDMLKGIGFDGTERLEVIDAADAIYKAARYRKRGMDFATCRSLNVQTGLEFSAALGCRYIWLTNGENGRDTDWDVFCRRAEALIRCSSAYGLRAAIHNHLGQRVQNQAELIDFLERCPQAGLLLDVGHLLGAGGDCLEIIRRYADRLVAVHFKDIFLKDASIGLESWTERLRFTELGGGNAGLDFQPIADELRRAGFDGWVFIEQDTHNADMARELQISFNYLKTLGLAN